MSGCNDKIIDTFDDRNAHMCFKSGSSNINCDTPSKPGAVTGRTCVFGGARIVLMPIKDCLHLVHGPVGSASHTANIRGSRSSDSKLYQKPCSSDLQESDIIFGGEKKLFNSIIELVRLHPEVGAVFLYATCVSGLIGDDIGAVAKRASEVTGKRVIPVQSEGFRSHQKSVGHSIGAQALLDHVIGTSVLPKPSSKFNVNLVGQFNVAGDVWGIKPLLEELGINIVSIISGDSGIEEIAGANYADLNVLECAKSSKFLAREMKVKYGIPFISCNFFGISSTISSLKSIVDFFDNNSMRDKLDVLISRETKGLDSKLVGYRERLAGKKIAIFAGGNKSWSLLGAFQELGCKVIMTGSKNGTKSDYKTMINSVEDNVLIVDDLSLDELKQLLIKFKPDLLVSGAKEKYVALKLMIGFTDFNHDRIKNFSGFLGFLNFAEMVDTAINTGVWQIVGEEL
jgi:nitrogenase molybdenum-cofactor synthesis protein NifE